jgi:hypothetical protein
MSRAFALAVLLLAATVAVAPLAGATSTSGTDGVFDDTGSAVPVDAEKPATHSGYNMMPSYT